MSDNRIFKKDGPLVAEPALASPFSVAIAAKREEHLNTVIDAEKAAVAANTCPIKAYVAHTIG